MRFAVEFSEEVSREICEKAAARKMEPESWLTMFVLQNLDSSRKYLPDADFRALTEKIFSERAGAFEALAQSEREDAATAPEELAQRRGQRTDGWNHEK